MKKNSTPTTKKASRQVEPKNSSLRLEAEARLAKKRSASPSDVPVESQHLLHELQVHQVELEMQNEELTRVREELETSRARYFNLFDLAPVGFVTLDEEGVIQVANLTAASQLGLTRDKMVNQTLAGFVLPEDQDIFYFHRRELFESGTAQSCEVRMRSADHSMLWIRMEGRILQAENGGPRLCQVVLTDITDHKQVEEKLQASEARFHTLVETAQDLIWQCDAEGRYVYLNPAWEEAFGYKLEEMLGKRFVDFQTPEYAQRDLQEFKRLLKGDIVKGLETVHKGKDGQDIHLVFNAKQLQDADGKPAGTQGTAFDITQRKKTEIELRLKDVLLYITSEMAKVGGWEFDVVTMKGTWTDEVARIHDLDPTLPTDVERGLSFYKPDSRQKVEQAIQEAIEFKRPYDLELQMVSAKGNQKWVRTMGLPMVEGGKVIKLRGIFQDITARRLAEERIRNSELELKKAQSYAHVGSWIWNIKEGTHEWSDEMYSIFGISRENFSGNLEDVVANAIHPEDREKVEKSNASVANEGKPIPLEYRILHPDGSQRVVWAEAGEMEVDGEGKPSLLRGIVMDITERKRAEDAIKSERNIALQVMNSMGQGLSVTNKQGLFEFINPAYAKMIGYELEDLLGKSPEVLTPLEDRHMLAEARIRRSKGETTTYEINLKHSDGHLVPVTITGTPRWVAGEINGSIAVITDLTERRQAEQEKNRLLGILEASLNEIYVFDPSTLKFSYVNNAALKNLGYPLEEIRKMTPVDLKPEFTENTFRERIAPLLVDEKETLVFQTSHLRKDGTLYPTEVHLQVARHEEEKVFLAMVYDITERKKTELELQHHTEDMQLVNKINEVFNRGESLDAIIEFLNNEICRIFSVKASTVSLLSEDQKFLIIQRLTISPTIIKKIEKLIGQPIPKIEVPIQEGGYIQQILQNETGTITRDPELIQKWILEFSKSTVINPSLRGMIKKLIPQIYKTLNIRSTLTVPLISNDRTIGLFEIASEDILTEDVLSRVRGIGAQLTAAIIRMRAEEEIRQRNVELNALNSLGRQISQSIELDEVVSGAGDELVRTVRSDLALIFLRDRDQLTLAGMAPQNMEKEFAQIPGHRIGECLCGMAVREGRPLYSHNIHLDDRCTGQECKKAGYKSFAALPLFSGNEIIGVVGLASRTERNFELQAGFLETIAIQIASGLHNAQLYEQSERHRKDIATLLEVSQTMTASLELEAVLQMIVDTATSLVGLDTGAIYHFKGEGMLLGATTPPLPPEFPESLRRMSLEDHPHIRQCMAGGHPVILPDAASADFTPQEQLAVEARGLRSILYIPLLIGKQSVGTLILGTVGKTRNFSSSEMDLFVSLSNQAAMALENADLYSKTQQVAIELEKRVEELDLLQKTVLDTTASQNLPGLLEAIVERACQLVGAPAGGLYMNDPEKGEVRCAVSYNTPYNYVGVVLKHGEGVSGKIAQNGQPLNIPDYSKWLGRSPTFEMDKPFSAVLGAPLLWGGKVNGVIVLLHYEEGRSFDKTDQELATLFAGHAAIAIENSRLLETSLANEAEVRNLSIRLAEAEENERRRIARELHDQVGQSLSALSINMNIMHSQIPEYLPGFKRRLDDSLMLIDQTTNHIRNLMSELRPAVLDDYGLKAALDWVAGSIASRTNLKLQVEGDCNRFPARVEIALFRIAQEALGNIARHARARNVKILLKQDGAELSLSITDDGVGFDPATVTATDRSGWGLRLMAERAESIGGSLRVESSPGQGTCITVEYHDKNSVGR